MINIIGEDCRLNPQLTEFPSSNINIAIFGTQSSGKSTLINACFGTSFPVMDSKRTRERCTKGVWFQNTNSVNVIDTEGFDSMERAPEGNIIQKQVALLCLALSDVLIINMWMNEVGRYEGSHSHILKSIINICDRIISCQQRRIIFVVKDCTVDADRDILKEELSSHVNEIVRGENKKATLKFIIEYFFMSHYIHKKNDYIKEAKEFSKLVTTTKKSNLTNYSPEERLFYIKGLWEKITSADTQIDLKSIEEALKSYALQKLKAKTLRHIQAMLLETTNLDQLKNYQRYSDHFQRESLQYFNANKARHLKEKEVSMYVKNIGHLLENKVYFNFANVVLANEEARLLLEFEKTLDSQMNSLKLEKVMGNAKKDASDKYKLIVKSMHQSQIYINKFTSLLEERALKYYLQVSHLVSLFETQLEKELNVELDGQLERMKFDEAAISKAIDESMLKYLDAEYSQTHLMGIDAIWEKVGQRNIRNNLVKKIEEKYQQQFHQLGGYLMSPDISQIKAFFQNLQAKTDAFCLDVINFHYSKAETTEEYVVPSQIQDQIREKISELLNKAIIEQRKKFKLSLAIVGVLMVLCYGEVGWMLGMLMKKKRLRVWMWVYIATTGALFAFALYRKKQVIMSWLAAQADPSLPPRQREGEE